MDFQRSDHSFLWFNLSISKDKVTIVADRSIQSFTKGMQDTPRKFMTSNSITRMPHDGDKSEGLPKCQGLTPNQSPGYVPIWGSLN